MLIAFVPYGQRQLSLNQHESLAPDNLINLSVHEEPTNVLDE